MIKIVLVVFFATMSVAGAQTAEPATKLPLRQTTASETAAVSGRASLVSNIDAFTLDVQSVAGLATSGRALLEQDPRKKSWGQYCGDSRAAADAGEFRRAVREASKALYLGKTSGDAFASAYASRDLSIAYAWAGDLDLAERWASDALETSKKISNAQVNIDYEIRFEAYKVLGDVALRRNQTATALKHYLDARSKLPFIGGGFYKDAVDLSIAVAQIELQQTQEAVKKLQSLVENGDANVRLMAMRAMIRHLVQTGDSALAAKYLDRLQVAAKENKNRYQTAWAWHLTSQMLAADGKASQSIDAALQSVKDIEAVGATFRSIEMKTSMFGNVQEIFENAISLLAKSGRVDDAFHMSEKARARTTLEQLRNVEKTAAKIDPDVVTNAINSAAYQPLTVGAVQKRLPIGSHLISYHVLPKQTMVWNITSDSVKLNIVDIDRTSLRTQIESLRSAIQSETAAAADENAKSLYTLLVAPLALPPNAPVILAPHSALHFLPFQALKSATGWWIETRPISYVLSASSLNINPSAAKVSFSSIVAVGNPDTGERSLDLPGAEEEVQKLGESFKSPKIFTRADATKNRVKLDGPLAGVLHIAAHGTVDDIDPMFSTIKLADPLFKRGDLEAHEFIKMKLSETELVVLSACSSGLGRVASGDEFSGFKRAVMISGVQRLLISLWPVDDEATSKMMIRFYALLKEYGAPEALQRAQMETLAKPVNSSPRLWAPFILVGSGI